MRLLGIFVSGNTATCSVSVEVEDTESPVVECPDTNNPNTNDEGESYAYLDYEVEVSDNCEVERTVYSVDNEVITFSYDFPVGSSVVNVLVTDFHGITSTCSFSFVVEDTEAPVVECPVPDNPYSNDEGDCVASLDFEVEVSDNCEVESTVYSDDNETIVLPYEFLVGSTVVNVLVTDIPVT